MSGGPGGSWDVQRTIPLKSIFCLSQALKDRVEPVGAGEAVSLLVNYVRQASGLIVWNLSKEEARILHLEQFDNICDMARSIPTRLLHISLIGAFWDEIDRALEDSEKVPENCIR